MPDNPSGAFNCYKLIEITNNPLITWKRRICKKLKRLLRL